MCEIISPHNFRYRVNVLNATALQSLAEWCSSEGRSAKKPLRMCDEKRKFFLLRKSSLNLSMHVSHLTRCCFAEFCFNFRKKREKKFLAITSYLTNYRLIHRDSPNSCCHTLLDVTNNRGSLFGIHKCKPAESIENIVTSKLAFINQTRELAECI